MNYFDLDRKQLRSVIMKSQDDEQQMYIIEREGQTPLYLRDLPNGTSILFEEKKPEHRRWPDDRFVIRSMRCGKQVISEQDCGFFGNIPSNSNDYGVEDVIEEIKRYNSGKRIDLNRGPLNSFGLAIAHTLRELAKPNRNISALDDLKGIGYFNDDFLSILENCFDDYIAHHKKSDDKLSAANDMVSSLEKAVLAEEPEVDLDDAMVFFKIIKMHEDFPFDPKYVFELGDLVKSLETHQFCRSESENTKDREFQSVLDSYQRNVLRLWYVLDCADWPLDRFVVAAALEEYKIQHLALKEMLNHVDFVKTDELVNALDKYEASQKIEGSVSEVFDSLKDALTDCARAKRDLTNRIHETNISGQTEKINLFYREYINNIPDLKELIETVAKPILDNIHEQISKGSSGRFKAVSKNRSDKEIFFNHLMRAFYLKNLRKERLPRTDAVQDRINHFLKEDFDCDLENVFAFFLSFYEFISNPLNFKMTI